MDESGSGGGIGRGGASAAGSRHVGPGVLCERCVCIYGDYVATNSIKQVNLPGDIVALVARHVEQIREWTGRG